MQRDERVSWIHQPQFLLPTAWTPEGITSPITIGAGTQGSEAPAVSCCQERDAQPS